MIGVAVRRPIAQMALMCIANVLGDSFRLSGRSEKLVFRKGAIGSNDAQGQDAGVTDARLQQRFALAAVGVLSIHQ